MLQPAINAGASFHSCSTVCQTVLCNSGKHHAYNCSVGTVEYSSGPANEEKHRVRSGRIPNAVSVLSCGIIMSRSQHIKVARAFTRVVLDRCVGFNHWPCGWTQFPASLASPEVGLAPSPTSLVTWWVYLVTTSHSDSSLYTQVGFKGIVSNKDIPI